MSNSNCFTNKLTNGKNSYFVINDESLEPKENQENQTLTDTQRSTPKKG